MDALLMQNSCRGKEIFRLKRGFSAGKRYTAAGLFIEAAVAKDLFHELLQRKLFSIYLQCVLRAIVSAFSAMVAEAFVNPVIFYGMFWADLLTFAAVRTFMRQVSDLHMRTPGFRIGAPGTAKLTAFEKYRCAYPVSVMNTISLNAVDHRAKSISVRSMISFCISLFRSVKNAV